jgi:hypothetical protein
MPKGAVRMERKQVPGVFGRPNVQHDDMTPNCALCMEPHIGVHKECTITLRGQFVFNPEQGMTMFVVDPAAAVTALELPTGQLGIILDQSPEAAAIHNECYQTLLTEVCLSGMYEEEEELDGEEDEEELEDEEVFG